MNQSPGNKLTKIKNHAKGLFNSAIIILGVYHKALIKVNKRIVKFYKARFSTQQSRLLIAFTLYSTKVVNRLENCR